MLILTLALMADAPMKLAMLPLQAGSGVSTSLTTALGEAVAAEIRRHPNLQLITEQEIRAVLSVQQLELMVGCSNDSCLAEIGGALGADRLVSGSLAKIGKSYMVHLKLIDPKEVRTLSTSDRRIKDGDMDAVLDALPAMVSELVGKAPPPAAAPPTPTFAPDPPPSTGPLPQGWLETPYAGAAVKDELVLVTDGKGRYVAFEKRQDLNIALFGGDSKNLWLQRVAGGSRDGKGGFDLVFWEPRVSERWRGSFRLDDGVYKLQCGDQAIVMQEAPRSALAGIKLYGVRWQRQGHWIGRDEAATYYYVDKAREADEYRLFVGTKGKVAYHPVRDAVVDDGGQVFVTDAGRLIVRKDETAAWSAGGREAKLTGLDLYAQARMIYKDLGPYAGQALGTPCDGLLK